MKHFFYLISFFVEIVIKIREGLSNHRKNIQGEKQEGKQLLIIFINAIGDFVIFTSILPALKKKYGEYKITLLGFDRWGDLIKNCPFVDKFILFKRPSFFKNPLYQYKFISEFRGNNYNIALYPSFSRMPMGDMLMKWCRANEKIGYNGDTNNISKNEKKRNNTFYTRLIEKPIKKTKEIDYFHHFAKELGVKKEDLGFPTLWLTDNDRKYAVSFLKEHGITDNDKFVVLCPGAASKKRLWNPSGYAEVCNFLNKNGYKIVITGSKKEHYISDSIQRLTKIHHLVILMEITLRELVAIYERAVLYIGSETGPLQIAMAVDIPTICIMGGGHAFRFYPYGNLNIHRVVFKKMPCYGCNWHCIYPEALCIKNITPEDVIKEIKHILKEIRKL